MPQYSLSGFCRAVGRDLLVRFLEWRGYESDSFPQVEKRNRYGLDCAAYFRNLGGEVLDDVEGLFERCNALADETGEIALLGAVRDLPAVQSELEAFTDDRQRALRVMIEDPDRFTVAEVQYIGSYYRRTRYWNGFRVQGEVADDIRTRKFDKQAFEATLKSLHPDRRSLRSEVEPPSAPDDDLLVYIDSAEAVRQVAHFRGDVLRRDPMRLSSSCSAIFSPRRRRLEVAGKYWRNVGREDIATAFFADGLGVDVELAKMQPLSFDLRSLAGRDALPVLPEDPIRSARVVEMRWRSELRGSLSFGYMHSGDEPSWPVIEHELTSAAAERLRKRSPSFTRIVIEMEPTPKRKKSEKFDIALHAGGKNNLREHTKARRLILQKYLPYWGVIEEVEDNVDLIIGYD